jgi:hypothetical protein
MEAVIPKVYSIENEGEPKATSEYALPAQS